MIWLLLLFIVAGVLILAFKLRQAENVPIVYPYTSKTALHSFRTSEYRKRATILNNSERAFFYELKKQLPSGYHVFPNMRIADMIQAVDGKGFYGRRNKILPKHIDFLICDAYFRPVLAIEVNGSSHRRVDRMERDELVRSIFADAKLPLEFIDVGTNFAESINRIRTSISA
jgi:hypothetical protein